MHALVMQKLLMNGEEVGEAVYGLEEQHVSYVVLNEVFKVNPRCQSVQLIRRGGIVQSDKLFSSQRRVIRLVDEPPYEVLQAFVTNSLSPFLKLVQSPPCLDFKR